MPSLIQRYLAINFLPPFLLACGFFVTFLLTSQLFRLTSIVVNNGVDLGSVLELFGHIAISFLPMAVPLSALFATIITLNKLSEDSEIVAMRSFGMTKAMMLKPIMVMAILVAVAIFALNRNLIPYSKLLFRNTVIMLTSKGMTMNIQAGQFFTDVPNVILFAEQVSDEGQRLEDIFIQTEGEDGVESVIFAEKGVIHKQEYEGVGFPTLRLHLTNGNIVRTQKQESDAEKILFKEYDFPLVAGGGQPGFITKDSMLSNNQLWKMIQATKKGKEFDQKRIAKMEIEYWSRWNTPVQVLVFVFLGFGLGIKKGRGKAKNTSVQGLIVLILYYAAFFSGVSLAQNGIVPSWFVVFMPSALALIFGINSYKKLDWAS